MHLLAMNEQWRCWSAVATCVTAMGLLGGVLAHVDEMDIVAIVENGLLATLAILVVTEAGLLGTERRTTRQLLLACSGLLFLATAVWEFDRWSGGRIEVSYADWAAILSWLGAIVMLRHGLRHNLIERQQGQLFAAVFLVHSVSVAVDLVDHELLARGLSQRTVDGLCEGLELAFMGGYALCIARMAWVAWMARFVPAVARTASGPGPAGSVVRQAAGSLSPSLVPVDAGAPAAAEDRTASAQTAELSSAFLDLANDAEADVGRRRFEALCGFGIESHHRVVDYGCGNLRVGEHFMQFLEPERYFGLDSNEAILRSGFGRLDEALLLRKRPYLAVVRDRHLLRVRALQPDWIVCTSVAMHVPPQHLRRFLGRICMLAAPQTRMLLTFDHAEEGQQIGRLAWARPEHAMVRELRRRLPRRPIVTRMLEDIDPFDGRPWGRCLIFIGPARLDS